MPFEDSRILVVDQDADLRSRMAAMLQEMKFAHVAVAEDGSAALKALDKDDFDLILSDVLMKPMDGLEFLSRLRRAGGERFSVKKARTPVMFITASDDPAHIQQARSLGVAGYLLKPVTKQALRFRLTKLFNIKKA